LLELLLMKTTHRCLEGKGVNMGRNKFDVEQKTKKEEGIKRKKQRPDRRQNKGIAAVIDLNRPSPSFQVGCCRKRKKKKDGQRKNNGKRGYAGVGNLQTRLMKRRAEGQRSPYP